MPATFARGALTSSGCRPPATQATSALDTIRNSISSWTTATAALISSAPCSPRCARTASRLWPTLSSTIGTATQAGWISKTRTGDYGPSAPMTKLLPTRAHPLTTHLSRSGALPKSAHILMAPVGPPINYPDIRNIDHTNRQVRRDILRYLLELKSAGLRRLAL